VAAPGRSRLELAQAFTGAAGRYWLGVFPQVGRELRHWQRRAQQIPDPALRRLALLTQRAERGNLEGAAAFAVLAPRSARTSVVRAAVAFQATYDYIDTLAEQPCSDPTANGAQLHLALLTALQPQAVHRDYYKHHPASQDDGYIRNLIDTCRGALQALPSYDVVAEGVLRAARRMTCYQALNHNPTQGPLALWASRVTPRGSGLRWWETAAGTASSLGVFALFAAASQPLLGSAETRALEAAYFPWIGALHVLLDSLIDRAGDLQSGQHSLVDHYASPEEAAARLSAIAGRAVRATEPLSQSVQHATILAAMTSFYLSAPEASAPPTQLVAERVLETMGTLATPTMLVLRGRRTAESLRGAESWPRITRQAVRRTRNSSSGLSTCPQETASR
jgi:tetraprenyl-beta-curcumene synthase